jgi:hypothetical protein
VSRRGNSSISTTGNRNRRSTGGLRCAVGHCRRVVAELDARLASTDGTTIGDKTVRTVGSHGDGALARMIGTVEVSAAASDSRDSGGDGGFAVHRRR